MRGHIRNRGASWAIVYDLPRDPSTGKRRKKWQGGFRTRRDAQRALADVLASLDRGTFVEPTKLTVGEYLVGTWLPAVSHRLRPSTLVGYQIVVEKQLVPRIGPLAMQRITPADLNRMYAELIERGRRADGGPLSPRYVRMCHTILRKALADAVRWGLIARNVADSADPPSAGEARRQAERKRRVWSRDQLQQFLRHVQGERLYPAYLLAATTGMRRGEILGLRWCDVDLESGRLSVTQTVIAPRYQVQISSPKTEKGKRAVALDTKTVEALRVHRECQRDERSRLAIELDETALAFAHLDGSPIVPHLFTLAFQRSARAAGVPVIRFHDLRHTYATLALQLGVHPKVVSERLGHASIAITLDTYSHVIPTMQESAAALVAAAVLPDHDPFSFDRVSS
jgi:integrase